MAQLPKGGVGDALGEPEGEGDGVAPGEPDGEGDGDALGEPLGEGDGEGDGLPEKTPERIVVPLYCTVTVVPGVITGAAP